MSRAASPTSTSSSTAAAGGQAIKLDVAVNPGDVLRQIVNMPPAVLGVFGEFMFDLMSHHRSSVLKHHGLPAKQSATAMIATRLHRYGRKRKDPQSLSDIVGESFAAAEAGETYGDQFFAQLERGASVSSRVPMAVNFKAIGLEGMARTRATAKFREELARNAFFVTPGGYLVRDNALSSVGPAPIGGSRRRGRTELVGRLVKRRAQRPVLGFHKQWDSVWARHAGKWTRALDLAQTAAGQAKIVAEMQRAVSGKSAAFRAYHDTYKSLASSGMSRAERRKVAGQASKAARALALTPKGKA